MASTNQPIVDDIWIKKLESLVLFVSETIGLQALRRCGGIDVIRVVRKSGISSVGLGTFILLHLIHRTLTVEPLCPSWAAQASLTSNQKLSGKKSGGTCQLGVESVTKQLLWQVSRHIARLLR